MEYELTRVSANLLRPAAELHARQWGSAPCLSEEYLAWKYGQNPYSDDMQLYAAVAEGGEIAAIGGMYGGLLSNGSARTLPISAGSDALVAPEHRGLGLFNKLSRFTIDDMADRGHDYALSLSANRASELVARRTGWLRVCGFRPFYWGSQPEAAPSGAKRVRSGTRANEKGQLRLPIQSAAFRYLRRLKKALKGAPESTFQQLQRRLDLGHGRILVESTPRPLQMAELVRRCQKDEARFSLVRDDAYYSWRFADPHSSYRFLFREAGSGELDSFMVLQQSRRGGGVSIVDWQFDDQRQWLDMLGGVLSTGSLTSLGIWSATLPPSLAQGLQELGFQPGSEGDTRTDPARGLLLNSTCPQTPSTKWSIDGKSLLQPEGWDLRMIFSDNY